MYFKEPSETRLKEVKEAIKDLLFQMILSCDEELTTESSS